MKKLFTAFAMAAIVCGAADPKTVKFDFATQPELTTATYPDRRNLEYMEKSFAIPAPQAVIILPSTHTESGINSAPMSASSKPS